MMRLNGLLHLALSLLSDPAERRLGQQEAEIERLRCQLEAERADLDEARKERDQIASTLADVARAKVAAEEALAAAQQVEGINPETGRYDAYLVEKRKRKEAERQRDVAQQDAADTLATARQRIDLMASARDAALRELDRLRDILTPRTYHKGDPKPF